MHRVALYIILIFVLLSPFRAVSQESLTYSDFDRINISDIEKQLNINSNTFCIDDLGYLFLAPKIAVDTKSVDRRKLSVLFASPIPDRADIDRRTTFGIIIDNYDVVLIIAAIIGFLFWIFEEKEKGKNFINTALKNAAAYALFTLLAAPAVAVVFALLLLISNVREVVSDAVIAIDTPGVVIVNTSLDAVDILVNLPGEKPGKLRAVDIEIRANEYVQISRRSIPEISIIQENVAPLIYRSFVFDDQHKSEVCIINVGGKRKYDLDMKIYN